MVHLATLADADVVHGSGGIRHGRRLLHHRSGDDAANMIRPVGCIVIFMLWENYRFYVFLEVGGHTVVAPPLVGIARTAVGHVDDAAIDEALLLKDVAHRTVVVVGVDTQVGGLLFGVVESDVCNAFGTRQGGQAVQGGVGGTVVNPSSVVDIAIGRLNSRYQGKSGPIFNNIRYPPADIILDVLSCGIAHPLRHVAGGAHHAARMVIHLKNDIDVIDSGMPDFYFHTLTTCKCSIYCMAQYLSHLLR